MKINSSVAASSYLLDAVTNNIGHGSSVRSFSLHSVRSIIMKLMLVVIMVGGWNVVWGQSTVTITVASSGISGAPYQSSTFVQNGVTFGYTNWLKSTNIQAKASTTNSLYNVTAFPGKILNITFKQTGTARSITVYGGTSSQPTSSIASPATAATMTFDFSSYNYTFFSMKTPGNACYFDEIIITYESAPLTPCRVDFNFGAGHSSTTPATTSLIEASAGAGITLPSATAPTGCDPEYTFFGWATSTVNETMTAPIIVGIAGQTYHPSENITLYAVYKQINREEIIVTYDFSDIPEFDAWGTSYSSHEVEYSEATVTFENANHQSSGTLITDIPVTKGDDVFVVMNNATQYIKEATFVCRQWGTKTQTITLSYSTNGGSSYTSTGTTSTNFTISNNNLPAGTNAVKISFSNSSNQVGIESCTIKNPSIITYNSNPSCVPCEADPAISPTALNFSDITSSSVTVEAPGGITSFGENCHIRSYGFVYGTSANPTLASGTVEVAGTSYTTINSSFNKGIDGLSPCTTYHVRAYATNGHGTVYGSDCTFTTGSDVSIVDLISVNGETSVTLLWNLSGEACESGHYVAICRQGSSSIVSSCDNYDFTAISANSTFGSGTQTSPGEYAVYSGTETSLSISGLVSGTTYTAAVFFVDDDGNCLISEQITFEYREITVLERGDLAIVGVDYYIGYDGADEISFVIFKSIKKGTSIDITDNGYERVYPGLWGTSEAILRFTWNDNTPLPRGSFITIKTNKKTIDAGDVLSSRITIYVNGSVATSKWDMSFYGNSFGFNEDDQIWIMQGGEWIEDLSVDVSGAEDNNHKHNKRYTGNVLYGFTATGWMSEPNYDGIPIPNSPNNYKYGTRGSTLYPGCECYMTDITFTENKGRVKYKGDISTMRSKYEWIGLINDISNWENFSSTEDYHNDAVYDFSAITERLPISDEIPTTNTWAGYKDRSWCNCANWYYLIVPDESTDVTIPEIVSPRMEVNIPAPSEGIVECKTLTIRSGGKVASNDSDAEMSVYGDINVESGGLLNLGNTNPMTLNLKGNLINEGSFITSRNLSMNLFGNTAVNIDDVSTGIFSLNNLSFHANNSTFDASVIKLYGNFNDQSPSNSGLGNQEIHFVGDAQQTINNTTAISDVTINNTSVAGVVVASGKMLNVSAGATFVDGIVNGNVTFAATATSSGATINSYVDGTVTKKANASAFTFPTGSNGVLGKLEIPATGLAADTDLKFNHDPDGFSSSEMPVWWNQNNMCPANGSNDKFDHVSNMYFWNLGTSSPMEGAVFTVTADGDIHFNDATVEHEEADIAMAIYDGCWKNLGGAASTNATSYSYISISDVDLPATRAGGDKIVTFGSIDHNTLLPIELVSFAAECKDGDTEISWTTASEYSNDYFVLERSYDAVNFAEVARIAGAGNSISQTNYSYTVYGSGSAYYRLVQVDYDGTSTVSEMIVAECSGESDGDIDVKAYPNPFAGDLTLRFENLGGRMALVEVYDMLGRMLVSRKVLCSQNDYELVMPLEGLPDGAYNVRVSAEDVVINRQVVKE